jgi:hypothetical protein
MTFCFKEAQKLAVEAANQTSPTNLMSDVTIHTRQVLPSNGKMTNVQCLIINRMFSLDIFQSCGIGHLWRAPPTAP